MTTSLDMQRLRDVLDAFGADSSRWPAEERAVLEPFVAGNAEAGRLLAEEAAFDNLLAHAADTVSAVSVQRARSSLLAQIESEAATAGVPAAGNVIPLLRRPSAARQPQAHVWRDVGVMAAALLLGFFTVSTGALDGSVLDPAQLAARVASDADDVSAVALGSTEDDLMQEEML
jgi:hypothetical protein